VVDDISHEGLRALLRDEDVSFQAVKTFKASTDPDYDTKTARVLQLYAPADGLAECRGDDPGADPFRPGLLRHPDVGPAPGGPPPAARGPLRLCRFDRLAAFGSDPADGRRAVRPSAGGGLERAASEAGRSRPLGRLRRATDRGRHGDPAAGRAHLPRPTTRSVKTLWLWWAGPGRPDLDRCWRAYIRRFDLEHTFRFCKQALGLTTPRVRTPEQADRWTRLVLLAYTQLRLARPIAADTRLPWERRLLASQLTPTRIRRDFDRPLPTLSTPASPPKPCGRSSGRPAASRRGPTPRQPAIKKAAA
jgi:hypothetical protein